MKSITHSSATCAKSCLRKYRYQYIDRLAPVRLAGPLRIGDLFHRGLEAQEPLPPQPYPGWATDEESRRKWDDEQVLASICVMAHIEHWKDSPLNITEREVEFSAPLTNGWMARGKVDGLAVHKDGLAIVEAKTCSESVADGAEYWDKLRIDQQVSHYVVCMRAAGYDVRSTIYDVTQKPGVRTKLVPATDANGLKIYNALDGTRAMKDDGTPYQSGKAGEREAVMRQETLEEYAVRCAEIMRGAPDDHFNRREVPRLESDLREYEVELLDTCGILEYCEAENAWPRNTGACYWYGNRCRFYDLCYQGWQSGDQVPEGFRVKDRKHEELGGEAG